MSIGGNIAGFSVGLSFVLDERNNFGGYFYTSGGPGYTYFGDSPLRGVIGWGVSFDIYENNSSSSVLDGIVGESYDFSGGYNLMGGYSRPISPETGQTTSEGVHKVSLGFGKGFRATRTNTLRLW